MLWYGAVHTYLPRYLWTFCQFVLLKSQSSLLDAIEPPATAYLRKATHPRAPLHSTELVLAAQETQHNRFLVDRSWLALFAIFSANEFQTSRYPRTRASTNEQAMRSLCARE